MQVIKIKCFALEVADGGGMYNETVGYTSDETVAKKWADKSKGWRSYRNYEKTYVIVETFEEFELAETEKIKEQALKKLTSVERKALGLE